MIKNIKNINSEEIIDKVAGNYKYQILIAILTFLIGTCADFAYFYIGLNQTPPYVSYINESGVEIQQLITYYICENENYSIIDSKTYHNWVFEYDYYCSKLYVSIVSSSIIFGSLIGSVIGFSHITYHFGSKKSITVFGLTFALSSLILLFDNYWAVVLTNIIYGLCHTNIFMLRNAFISENVSKKHRSYFLFSQISSGVLIAIVAYPLFTEFISWRIAYFVNAGLMLVFIIVFYFFSVESLRVAITKGNIEELVSSVKYIMKMNGLSEDEFYKLVQSIGNANANKVEEVKVNTEVKEIVLGKLEQDLRESLIKVDIVDNNENNESKYNKDNSVVIDKYKEVNNNINESLVITKFLVAFSLYTIILMAAVFEISKFGSDINMTIFEIFSVLSIPLWLIPPFLMNIKALGRRYTIILAFAVISIIKSLNFFFDKSIEKYTYLVYRGILFSLQIPIHALINESFSTKTRLGTYGKIFFVAKIFALGAPFVLEYLSYTTYSIIIFVFLFIIGIIIFFLKETNHVNIE